MPGLEDLKKIVEKTTGWSGPSGDDLMGLSTLA
jgi:hypothetical protein